MKTAISIPNELFKGAERLARRSKKSRSRLYSDELQEYLARHAADELTEQMDQVCANLAQDHAATKDSFVSASTRRVLKQSEW